MNRKRLEYPPAPGKWWKVGRQVVDRLAEDGWEAVFVGGCVRDLVLGRAVRDVDVATAAPPEEVLKRFQSAVPTGLPFGTVTVLVGAVHVEVTTYRREGPYRDLRRPGHVVFTSRLEEDLARRDFTINAMALDASWNLIDPFGGLRDAAARRIAAVGDPRARLAEDALRTIRALRLAAELSFDLDGDTRSALYDSVPKLNHIASERIFQEWKRLVCGDVGRVAGDLVDSGFLAWWTGLAGISRESVQRWAEVCRRTTPSASERTAALFRLMGAGRESVRKAVVRWRADRGFQRAVEWWWEIGQWDPSAAPPAEWATQLFRIGKGRAKEAVLFCAALRGYGPEELRRCLDRLAEAERVQPLWTQKELAVPPPELCRAAGLSPGPEWGRFYRRVTAAVLEGRVANTPEALYEFARWYAGAVRDGREEGT